MNAGRAKVEAEGGCRVCRADAAKCDAAHLWPRSRIAGVGGFDEADLIVPLCSRRKGGAGCHEDFDAHRLDLLGHLTVDEEIATVRAAGSLEQARVRLAPSDYRGERAVARLADSIRAVPFD